MPSSFKIMYWMYNKSRLEKLRDIDHPSKVLRMDRGLDFCHIFITLNKKRYINFGFLYLAE